MIRLRPLPTPPDACPMPQAGDRHLLGLPSGYDRTQASESPARAALRVMRDHHRERARALDRQMATLGAIVAGSGSESERQHASSLVRQTGNEMEHWAFAADLLQVAMDAVDRAEGGK